MFSWIAWGATLILGPLVFFALSTILSRRRTTVRFPVGSADSLGDCIALPIFNGFAFGLGLPFDPGRLAIGLIVSTLAMVAYYRVSLRALPNWSKHDDSSFNVGGWYHLAYFFVQAWVVVYALLMHPLSVALWMSIVAYGVTVAYYLFVQLPNRQPRSRVERRVRSSDNET